MKVVSIVVALGTVLAGCSSGGGDATGDGLAAEGALTGSQWSGSIEVEGELVGHIRAIGGETTGRAIETDNATIELIVPDDLEADFIDGQHARVRGKKKILRGVERGDRKAITVRELLVCPENLHVNCMPPRTGKLCSSDDKPWYREQCGVQFTF